MRTAIVVGNRVTDIEELGDTPSERADGLTRIPCPDWVEVGCRFNGTVWKLEDGSIPTQQQIDAVSDAKESDRMEEFRTLLKAGAGTNQERIAFLERVVAVIIRKSFLQ